MTNQTTIVRDGNVPRGRATPRAFDPVRRPAADRVVTTTVLRNVNAGQEEEFEQALGDFFHRAAAISGSLGVYVVRPAPGSSTREYGIMRSFASEADRQRFYSSDLFNEWEAEASRFTEGDTRHDNLTGLEGWFTLPGAKAIIPPPRWKMALSTMFGGYVTGVFLYFTLKPLTAGLANLIKIFIDGASGTVLLTWVVMPNVTRVFGSWLHPRRRSTQEKGN